MNKRVQYLLYGLAALSVLGVGIFALWYQGVFGQSQHGLYVVIKDRPELVNIFNQITEGEALLQQDPEKVSTYLSLGLNWKSLGELSSERKKDFYNRSLAVYAEGIKRFGTKNILFYLNHGKVAELVEDYAQAEQDYLQAIALSPGDESGYISLAVLYDYKLHKNKEEIVAVFNKGIARLVDPTALIVARGSYLRRVGNYEAALEDYKVVVKKIPNNNYDQIIKELEDKIKAR